MIKRVGIAALVVLLAGVYARPALSEITAVEAEGAAPRLEDERETRALALENALKDAVTTALGEVLTEEAVEAYSGILNVTIYPNARDYVLNYRILSMGWITHLANAPFPPPEPRPGDAPQPAGGVEGVGVEAYHVWIEASVDIRRLKKEVRSMTVMGVEETSNVTLTVLGVTDYAALEELKRMLGRMEIVRDVSYRSFSRERFEVDVEVAGTARTLVEWIDREAGDRFVVVPEGGDRVVVRAARSTVTEEE
ncbi:MAG: hypothetical protein V3W31_09840 [Thermodesulfobacteriota bacterium]